jgi:hypothetical protein
MGLELGVSWVRRHPLFNGHVGQCCVILAMWSLADSMYVRSRIDVSGWQIYCVGLLSPVPCFVYYRLQRGSILDGVAVAFRHAHLVNKALLPPCRTRLSLLVAFKNSVS